MSKPKIKVEDNPLIRSDFNLGGGQAEADALLEDAFFETGHYRAAASKSERKCFLIGRTGSGKSAALRRIAEEHPRHVIRINPEDLSLPYITDLGIIQYLSSLNVHMDPLFIALWKHVLLIEIIKHRYNVDSQETTRRFITNLMDKVKRDRSKQAALEYLEEFEGRFWCETDERVREITKKFESQVKAEAGAKLPPSLGGVGLTSGANSGSSTEERTELIDRFQRIVNATQLPRLNKMMAVLDDDILDSPHHFTYVLIDDLDRDWADEKIANDLIRCLFRAVVDLVRVDHLKILVALRTNIFETLDFGRTGGQEEKFRSLTLRMRWTRGDLEALLSERTRVAAARHGLSHVSSIADLLPPSDKTRGNPLDAILSKTLMRPRDAIAFLNECIELASGSDRITWDAINAAEHAYSRGRLLALRDEWKPTFRGIEKVLNTFSGAPKTLTRDDLTARLDDCILLSVDPNFEGVQWMTQLGAPALEGVGLSDWAEMYYPLIQMLYNIGFLGYSLGRRNPEVFNHEEPEFMDKVGNLREVEKFVIHPAFRRALDIG